MDGITYMEKCQEKRRCFQNNINNSKHRLGVVIFWAWRAMTYKQHRNPSRFSGHAWLLKLILRCPAYLTQLPLHQWPLLYGTTEDNSSHDGQPCLSCRGLFRSVWPGDMPSVSQWVCWSCSFSICQQAVGQSWTECFMFIALNGKSELLTLWNYSQATPLHPFSPRYPNINKCYAMCLCTFVVFLFNCLSFIL